VKVTVCQMHLEDRRSREAGWEALAAHVRASESDLVLLPEMPFHRWFPEDPEPDTGAWEEAVEDHRRWMGRLDDTDGAVVAGTRPMEREGCRLNEAFLRGPGGPARGIHAKRHLPDEPGFWEASWYDRGPGDFDVARIGPARAGFLVCTELWFLEHARSYGRAGAHLLLSPRATPAYSRDRWLACGRTAAVVAGAYCLSSNRGPRGGDPRGGASGPGGGEKWAGGGWIIGPDGDVLAETGVAEPFRTLELDLSAAEAARDTYPRYVK